MIRFLSLCVGVLLSHPVWAQRQDWGRWDQSFDQNDVLTEPIRVDEELLARFERIYGVTSLGTDHDDREACRLIQASVAEAIRRAGSRLPFVRVRAAARVSDAIFHYLDQLPEESWSRTPNEVQIRLTTGVVAAYLNRSAADLAPRHRRDFIETVTRSLDGFKATATTHAANPDVRRSVGLALANELRATCELALGPKRPKLTRAK